MMEKLGISAFDSGGNFVGLEETIRRVYDATKDMTEEQRNAALAAIGGKQHLDALNALMGGLTTTTADGAIEWNALSDALYNSDGAMAKMAETVTNTWSGAKARLESAIQDLQINLVDTFAPYATSAINSVAAAIPNITAAIIPAAQGFVDYAIPRITAFKDRAVELFGMASEGISKVVSAHSSTFDKLGELGSRIGDIFASIQEKAQPVLDYIFSTGIPNVADGLLDLVDRLADLGLFLTEHKELVIAAIAAYAGFKGITALSNLGNKISNVSSLLAEFQGVTSSSGIAAAIAEGKLSKLTAVFGALTGQVKLTDIATEAAKAKLGSFKDGFKAIGIVAKNAFTGLKGGISSIGTTLAGLGSKITGFIAANPAVLIIAAIAAVIAIVVTLYNKCEWFREKVDAIIEAVKGYLSAFWEKAKEVFQKVWGIVQEVWGQIQPYLAAAWQAIISAVSAVVTFFQTNILPGIKAVWSSICGVFAAAWEAIKAVFAPVGAFFQSLWDTIVALFTSIGTAVGDAISGAVKGAINAVLKGAIGIINGFIDAINFAIGVINAIPGVSIEKIQKLEVPQLAKGGIVTAPTLLEAGEAGNEAIIPLGELWGNMQDMISTNLSGATDGIAALAEKFEAADIGGNTAPISDLLAKLDNLGNGDDDPDNGGGEPPVQIIYSPTNHYHFEGEAPSKEDIAGAESMSQDEFNRRVDQYFKDRQRKNFRG